jgi:hypothetical protein
MEDAGISRLVLRCARAVCLPSHEGDKILEGQPAQLDQRGSM